VRNGRPTEPADRLVGIMGGPFCWSERHWRPAAVLRFSVDDRGDLPGFDELREDEQVLTELIR
jgi:hypothetical protein